MSSLLQKSQNWLVRFWLETISQQQGRQLRPGHQIPEEETCQTGLMSVGEMRASQGFYFLQTGFIITTFFTSGKQ